MILVELLLPGFNNFTGKQLAVNYQSAGLYISLITIILFCGLLAGSYPAFVSVLFKATGNNEGCYSKKSREHAIQKSSGYFSVFIVGPA